MHNRSQPSLDVIVKYLVHIRIRESDFSRFIGSYKSDDIIRLSDQFKVYASKINLFMPLIVGRRICEDRRSGAGMDLALVRLHS